MKAVRPTSNRVPYLRMRSVGSHSKSGRGKEEKTFFFIYVVSVLHGAMGCGQKSFKLVLR